MNNLTKKLLLDSTLLLLKTITNNISIFKSIDCNKTEIRILNNIETDINNIKCTVISLSYCKEEVIPKKEEVINNIIDNDFNMFLAKEHYRILQSQNNKYTIKNADLMKQYSNFLNTKNGNPKKITSSKFNELLSQSSITKEKSNIIINNKGIENIVINKVLVLEFPNDLFKLPIQETISYCKQLNDKYGNVTEKVMYLNYVTSNINIQKVDIQKVDIPKVDIPKVNIPILPIVVKKIDISNLDVEQLKDKVKKLKRQRTKNDSVTIGYCQENRDYKREIECNDIKYNKLDVYVNQTAEEEQKLNEITINTKQLELNISNNLALIKANRKQSNMLTKQIKEIENKIYSIQ